MNNTEIWKPVVGFENLYEVSNLGKVRSIQFHEKPKIKELSQTTVKGYKFVKIRNWKQGYEGSLPVHRLVAEAFIPNPDNKPQVDHIDTNPSNNNVENLRWVTAIENQHNPLTLSRIKTSMISYNKSEHHKKVVTETQGFPINQYNLDGKFIKEYPSMSIAAKELNTTACCIKRVCDRERKYHRNFIFRYKNEEI